MSLVQFGTVVGMRKFRGYYEGTDALYEGMVLAYNSDTTTNYLGVNKATGAEGTTTADGYQNEGKFMFLEKPAAGNIKFIAGVVAGDGKSGKTGPFHVNLYELNGAVMPVRMNVSVTHGQALYVNAGSYLVTNVPGDLLIGYAMETVDRSGTAGLVLAKIDQPIPGVGNGVTAKTADFTLAAADNGKIFTNTGDTGAMVVTLPTASTVTGLKATFVIDAVQTIALSPAAGDKIVFGNGSDALADGEDLVMTPGDANDAGMNITIVSDGDNWQVVSAWATAVTLWVIP